MILVGQYDSPFVRRVAIALHQYELPFARNTISVFADAEAMRQINPLGRIPALVLDDGEVVVDSGAILDHLDERVGRDRAGLPAGGAARRRALRWVAIASGGVDKAGAIVYERALRPADKQHAPWVERCRTQLVSALAALEAEVAATAGWLHGDRPGHADVMVGCWIGYLRLRGIDALVPRHPALERFADACEQRPEFQATRPAADEAMPARPM